MKNVWKCLFKKEKKLCVPKLMKTGYFEGFTYIDKDFCCWRCKENVIEYRTIRRIKIYLDETNNFTKYRLSNSNARKYFYYE